VARSKRLWQWLAAIGAVALLAPAGSAYAATTIGQTSATPFSCTIDDTYRLQTGVADGTPYSAPSDGVITA
jgi:hypothetical protein